MNSNCLRAIFFVVLAALIIQSTGCGLPGGSGGESNGEEPVDFETFASEYDAEYHEAICEALWECPWRSTLRRFYTWGYHSRFESLEECKSGTAQPHFATSFPDVEDSLEAGRVEFDGQAAAECLQAIRASEAERLCGDVDAAEEVYESCDDIFTGTVAPDDYCLSDFDCAGEGECYDVADECYGRCIEPDQGSQGCGDGPTCNSDEYCSSADGECVPRGGEGDECLGQHECQDGHSCLDLECVPFYSRQEGQSCMSNGHCADGLACHSGVCEPIEVGQEGDECHPNYYPFCDPGLGCHINEYGESQEIVDAVCVAVQPEGEPCTTQGECQIGLYCDAPAGTAEEGLCQPKRALGESCTSSTECESYRCEAPSEGEEPECVEWSESSCEVPATDE